MIHPTAVIHSEARLGRDVQVGPFSVIDADVTVGDGCRIGPHVHVTGHTRIGAGNRIHTGAVIGDVPQDLKYRDEPTELVIGNDNVFREHVTVHRSARPGEATVIGSNCLLMAGSHVGHNCRVGDHVILANAAILGGHATIQDRAFLSGSCLVHQFITVGTLAMMQGGAAVSQDLPPFCVVRRVNELIGLNTVGLRRAGLGSEERLELRRVYHALFRRQTTLREALSAVDESKLKDSARRLVEFVRQSKRGCCSHARALRAGADE